MTVQNLQVALEEANADLHRARESGDETGASEAHARLVTLHDAESARHVDAGPYREVLLRVPFRQPPPRAPEVVTRRPFWCVYGEAP